MHRILTQDVGPATLEEWAKLDLSAPNSPVLRLTRVQLDDESHPLCVEEVVLALERFPGLAANGGEVPDITELAPRHGLSLTRIAQRIGIIPAAKDVALHLEIALGTDVLKMYRIVETADGKPIEWRVAYMRI
jgi:DNA-binding GntR family transcriptional regulator